MPDDDRVRPARRHEASLIAEIWLQSRRAAEIPPTVHSDAEVCAWISEVLLPSGQVWVATEDGLPVGMIALSEGWVQQLYVSAEHQRRGHGSRLLRMAQAQQDTLALWTFERNLTARRFYEAHGFVRSGHVSQENEEHAPAVLYRWKRATRAGAS